MSNYDYRCGAVLKVNKIRGKLEYIYCDKPARLYNNLGHKITRCDDCIQSLMEDLENDEETAHAHILLEQI